MSIYNFDPMRGNNFSFFCSFDFLSLKVLNVDSELDIQDVVAFITACISFISLIIGLLTIITKYFFPENDEQYITTIVESIQKNDLENKRENARYKKDKQVPSSDNDNK